MKRLLMPMLLLACAAPRRVEPARPARELEARQRVTAAVARLPSCAPDTATARLQFVGTCTLKACAPTACCNTCGWNAALVNASGASTELATRRVVELFDITASAYDCEMKVWSEVLNALDVSLNGTACAVRK